MVLDAIIYSTLRDNEILAHNSSKTLGMFMRPTAKSHIGHYSLIGQLIPVGAGQTDVFQTIVNNSPLPKKNPIGLLYTF